MVMARGQWLVLVSVVRWWVRTGQVTGEGGGREGEGGPV